MQGGGWLHRPRTASWAVTAASSEDTKAAWRGRPAAFVVLPLLALMGTHLLASQLPPGCALCLAVRPLPSAPWPANSLSLRVKTRAMFQGPFWTPTLLHLPLPPWPFPYKPHYLGLPFPLAANSKGPSLDVLISGPQH